MNFFPMGLINLKNNFKFLKILNKGQNLQFRKMSSSIHRQNFSPECENAINKQINMELTSSYAYLAMAFHFHKVALKGAYAFFKEASEEENKHAHEFMEYLNKRGGDIVLENIAAPKTHYECLLDGLHEALNMELQVNKSLLDLHEIASKQGDPNLCDFIESKFLQEQVDAQKQIFDYIQQLECSQKCVGSYIFDIELKKDGKMH